ERLDAKRQRSVERVNVPARERRLIEVLHNHRDTFDRKRKRSSEQREQDQRQHERQSHGQPVTKNLCQLFASLRDDSFHKIPPSFSPEKMYRRLSNLRRLD